MNILILSWRGPKHPNAGGAEISTHEHAKGWVRRGHSVTLFTSFYKGAKKEETLDGVWIIRQGEQILGVHFNALFWYLFHHHPKYDIIIDQFHGIPFFTPLYVKIKKLAFIHEVTKEVWRLNPWPKPFNLIPAFLGPSIEHLIFKLFYKSIPFMTVSDSTKKDLVSWGIPSKNIFVVHNGLNIPNFKKNPPKEKRKTVIFLGALSKDKGIEDALKAFSMLNSYSSDFQFWVVGKGDPRYLKKLKIQSKKIGISKRVKFFGFVSDKRKFELLSKAHVLINPSIREGWGLVVIEAAAMGTPTVAYNVPGLKDSVIHDKTGILCKNKSPKDLAKNIINILSDKRRYEKMCQEARQWSENFSWEKSSQVSLKLIEVLIDSKTGNNP